MTTQTTELTSWREFFMLYGKYTISLRNPDDPEYATAVSVERLYQLFRDRENDE